MYSKQEASRLRQKFWTQFGQYMRPVAGAEGDVINWLNYKTGIRQLYFRMDVDNKQATIAIELRHTDLAEQQYYFQKFRKFEKLIHQSVGENWHWQLHTTDEDGKTVSRIATVLKEVNIFNTADWSAIISFLKPRIIALDRFWNLVKEGFA
jgi:hypothetical protein